MVSELTFNQKSRDLAQMLYIILDWIGLYCIVLYLDYKFKRCNSIQREFTNVLRKNLP